MGGGSYSTTSYSALCATKSYSTKSREQIFESRSIDPEMNPHGLKIRESRDSAEHPNSVAIILALDVTGSMGSVPESIVRSGLPTLMDSILQAGFKDPQVLFMGIGDHVYDRAPLQVGQFESSAELLDKWLSKVYLEGGGGGNNWESYTLAWLTAARHTSIDCFEKRQQKGFLFTVGDEPINPGVPAEIINRLFGEGQSQSATSQELYEEVSKQYNAYHIHVNHDSRERTPDGWKEVVGQNLIILNDHTKLSKTIAEIVVANLKASTPTEKVSEKVSENPSEVTPETML